MLPFAARLVDGARAPAEHVVGSPEWGDDTGRRNRIRSRRRTVPIAGRRRIRGALPDTVSNAYAASELANALRAGTGPGDRPGVRVERIRLEQVRRRCGRPAARRSSRMIRWTFRSPRPRRDRRPAVRSAAVSVRLVGDDGIDHVARLELPVEVSARVDADKARRRDHGVAVVAPETREIPQRQHLGLTRWSSCAVVTSVDVFS